MEQMLERSVALKVAVVRRIGQQSGLWSVRIGSKTRRTLDPSFLRDEIRIPQHGSHM